MPRMRRRLPEREVPRNDTRGTGQRQDHPLRRDLGRAAGGGDLWISSTANPGCAASSGRAGDHDEFGGEDDFAWSGGPSSAGAAARAPQPANGATKVATTAAQYDPTLHMEAMLVSESLVYSGSGRNIFSASSVPALASIPKPIAPVRTSGVVLPVYTPPPGPPPLPPIDLKFFGTATKADGSRQAFLLHGEDVFLAAAGSIVQRRYKIGTIGTNSVEVEDLTNNNKQNLPLVKN